MILLPKTHPDQKLDQLNVAYEAIQENWFYQRILEELEVRARLYENRTVESLSAEDKGVAAGLRVAIYLHTTLFESLEARYNAERDRLEAEKEANRRELARVREQPDPRADSSQQY